MDTTPDTETVLHVGVDWLTATTPADGREWPLLLAADAILETEEQAGNEVERSRWQNYDLKGTRDVWAGAREDSAIVRLSGQAADAYWRRVVPHAKKITRLDLEVTVRPVPPDAHLAERHLDQLLDWRRGREQPFKVGWHGSPDGIETVYLGSRTSTTFGRIYDKYRESEEDCWRDSWRYEVECKDVVATRLARILVAEPDVEGPARVYVHDWFAKHGVRPRFARPAGVVEAPSTRESTDDDRTLRWWDDQVAAVYARLAPKVGPRRMLAALGASGGGTDATDHDTSRREVPDGNR